MQLKVVPKNGATEVQELVDTGNEDASCWICLEEGPDESGQPFRRDCSCHGESAGFGQISCLAKYAQQHTEDWDGRDFDEFVEPWKSCHSCRQDYQNELTVDLAAEFVTFVERKHPDNQLRHLETLLVKI